MKFSRLAVSSLYLAARSVSAFAPSKRAFVTRSTPLNANVGRLVDPEKNLLDQVDVFIFDCDGVIWRVRYCVLSS
jgi:hypothetical protein